MVDSECRTSNVVNHIPSLELKIRFLKHVEHKTNLIRDFLSFFLNRQLDDRRSQNHKIREVSVVKSQTRTIPATSVIIRRTMNYLQHYIIV